MSDPVATILEGRLETIWGSRTIIEYDNVSIKHGDGESFIRPMLSNVSSEAKSLSCQRESYLFTVQIFTERGEGTDENSGHAILIKNSFFNYVEGNLLCKNVRIERVGDEKEWHRRDVLIEVQYDNHF